MKPMASQPVQPPARDPVRSLLGALTTLLAFVIYSRTPIDADLWWHLRAGQVMWEQKSILLRDIFSYTRNGTPWVNAFWLSEIWMYALDHFGGYFLLAGFVALTGALTFNMIFRRLRGNPVLNGFLTLLAILTAAPIWGPRPQILSFLLIAWLDGWLAKKRASWILVPVFIVWVNVHGGWFWGFLLILAHLAGRLVDFILVQPDGKKGIFAEVKALAIWTVISAFAVAVNPNGLAIWKLPFQQVNVSLQIQEWLSPDFHMIGFHPMLWMVFLLLIAAPLAGRPNWPQLFKVLGFAYLTFVSQRTIALFAIVAVPLLAEWLNAILEQIARNRPSLPNPSLPDVWRRGINATLVILLGLSALANLYQVSLPAKVDAAYPTAALDWVQEQRPDGRIFNSYNWGGYLIWNLPDQPVFIDGRADMYGSDLIQEWHDVVNASASSEAILDKWDVQWVFLEPDWPIVTLLKASGWKIAYEDKQAVILERP
jgi:hypothetical protein